MCVDKLSTIFTIKIFAVVTWTLFANEDVVEDVLSDLVGALRGRLGRSTISYLDSYLARRTDVDLRRPGARCTAACRW